MFHSFGEFNVPTNNIANFLNDTALPTSNILGRVTGGNISNIFGTLQTTGFGNANLFLMNPAGFLFGPGATVNVGGMVNFTSADYLRLSDGARFNAIPNTTADALLSASPVAAFGFLGSNPGAITVQGSQLSVTPGQSLSLVGGNITVQSGVLDDGTTVQPARLSAPGGQINLASVASPGEILFPRLQSAPNINGQSFTAMGSISLSQGALLDVTADAAGTVRIRGGQLVIADATISADTNNANGQPTAVDINISGDMSITDTRGVPAITSRTIGSGNAGEVLISSGNFGASTTFGDPNFFHTLIDTNSAGTGAAGSVNISTGDLKITGNPAFTILTFIDSGPQGDGPGGNVTLTAQSIEMSNALISTGTKTAGDLFNLGLVTELPNGSGGDVFIKADTFIGNRASFVTSADTSFGSTTQLSGDITMNVRNLHFTGGGLDTTGISAGGVVIAADTVIMDASAIQSFTISGSGKGIDFNGRILELINGTTWSTSTFGDGAAGDIHVSASDHVSLVGRSEPNAFVSNPTGIFSNSFGFFGSQGAPGNIVITTPRLTMQGGRVNTTTLTNGGGGNVSINANVVEMSGELPPDVFPGDFFFIDVGNVHPSGIFTQTIGSEFCIGPCGNAGNINITTGSLVMGPGAQINSGATNTGQGGNISISSSGLISLSGTVSDGTPVGIFSRTIGLDPSSGAGGNISLTAGQSVGISNGAAVSTSTTGPGNAGNILVKANDIAISGGGTITAASTGAGNAGTVTIQGINSPANSFLVDGAGSGVFTNTEDTGAGGNIFVNANTVTISNGGTLSAKTSGTACIGTGRDHHCRCAEHGHHDQRGNHHGQQHRSWQHRQHSDQRRQSIRDDE